MFASVISEASFLKIPLQHHGILQKMLNRNSLHSVSRSHLKNQSPSVWDSINREYMRQGQLVLISVHGS
ncbi:MAG: hypothetical protein ACXWEW_07895 [Nitrososphaeraceae archaeon]